MDKYLPILLCICGTLAEISVSGMLNLPSMLFGREWTVRPSKKIKPVLMSIPAAVSLVQDLTFYYALTHVAMQRESILASWSLAMPVAILLSRLFMFKVFTYGMMVSAAFVLCGAAMEFTQDNTGGATVFWAMLVLIAASCQAMMITIES